MKSENRIYKKRFVFPVYPPRALRPPLIFKMSLFRETELYLQKSLTRYKKKYKIERPDTAIFDFSSSYGKKAGKKRMISHYSRIPRHADRQPLPSRLSRF